MTKEWLNNASRLEPGREIFRSDRSFHLLAYTASHSQLLLRSPEDFARPGDPSNTTIDVLFKPVDLLRIRKNYTGLVIRCATAEETDSIQAEHPATGFQYGERVFVLESEGETDYIVAMAVGWHEDVLPRTRPSFYSDLDTEMPGRPPQPLFGVHAGFNLASAQELITALTTIGDPPRRREKHRYVHVVMSRVDRHDGPRISGLGVFLDRGDAEEARARIAPTVAECWVQTLPIAV
ncbi:hypothetical protein ACU686_12505 [Yinghuangia aomiensis]